MMGAAAGAARRPGEGTAMVSDEARVLPPWIVWLRALAVVLVLAVALGAVVGGAFYLLRPADDGWRDLGAVVLGMVAGGLALAAGWLVALVVLVRRCARPDRRLLVGAVCVGALAVVAIGLAAVVSALPDDARWAGLQPSGVAAAVVGVVALVLPPLVVPPHPRGGLASSIS